MFTIISFLSDENDYIGQPRFFSQELLFSPGDTKKFVSIPIIDDNLFEGVEEFYGRLTTTDSTVNVTYPNAIAQIIDNDGEFLLFFYVFPSVNYCALLYPLLCFLTDIEIGFNPNSYTVNENDGSVRFFVENRNPEIETEVTVLFDTTDGTATSKSYISLLL